MIKSTTQRFFLLISLFFIAVAYLSNSAYSNPPVADERSRLADAVEQRDASEIVRLLSQNADVNLGQVDGMTALHWAVHFDDAELAETLLAANADPNITNRYGVMPLSLACSNGNPVIVKQLLDAGADANAKLRGGETVLMTAARTGRPEPVRLLLAAGAEVNAKETKQQTALMWAAAEGHHDVVKILIDAGADFAKPLKSGFTPFFFAVRSGHSTVAQTLLEQGIDINAPMQVKKKFGRSPSEGMSPLSLAVENGHFELAVMLLEQGANPNDQRTGLAPLHRMIWVRKPDRGDNLDGMPPPIGSGKMSSLQFVEKLVEHGADVNLQLVRSPSGFGPLNKKAATAFLMAAKTADLPLLKLLHQLGADPTLTNGDGTTPLMIAAGVATFAPGEEAGTESEAIAACKWLLELGADVNAVDKNGDTVMHGAALKGFPELAKFLDEQGADIAIWNRPNKRGRTPLVIATGYRKGNFRPLAPVIAAFREIMIDHSVEPPINPKPVKSK